jgi:ketosteroid isomerase-like protein
MSAKHKDIIAKVNAAFARNDVETVLSFCKDDFRWMAKAPPEPPKFTVDTVLAEGDFVTCIGDMTMNENGAVVPYAYCDVWRFEGDKLAELRAYVIRTKA